MMDNFVIVFLGVPMFILAYIYLGYMSGEECGWRFVESDGISIGKILLFMVSIPFCVVAWPVWLIGQPKRRKLYEKRRKLREFFEATSNDELVKILEKERSNFAPSQYEILKAFFESDNGLGSLTDREEYSLKNAKTNFNEIILKKY